MSKQRYRIVSGDESNIHDEPHIEGSRITVLYLREQVEERGLAPETVAEHHDINTSLVYDALAYYHRNPEEMRRVEQHRDSVSERIAAESSITPPDS